MYDVTMSDLCDSNSQIRNQQSFNQTSLQILQWISSGRKNILFHLHPESQNHINNNRRAER
jgi:hypothetical protein